MSKFLIEVPYGSEQFECLTSASSMMSRNSSNIMRYKVLSN